MVPDEGRRISAGQYEVLPMAAALDYARIALAPLLTRTSERILKLLDTPWSGLPSGLAARAAQLRGKQPLGRGTTRLWQLVSEHVPAATAAVRCPVILSHSAS